MSPEMSRQLNELARQKLAHAEECDKKAKEYYKAAADMRAAAETDRALVEEIGRLQARPFTEDKRPSGAETAAATAPMGSHHQ